MMIEGCRLPESFDQHLLDHASEMFGKWGMSAHLDEKEHLFEKFGLASKPEDGSALKMEKIALRCVCMKMMEGKFNRKDAATLIKNLNKIRTPSYQWLDE